MSKSDDIIQMIIKSELYDVRSDGTIYSRVSKQGHVSNTWRRIDKQNKKSGRYDIAAFHYSRVSVSRLVYWKFNGPIPNGMVVDHINEIRTDNRVENLQIMTPGENTAKSARENPQRLTQTYLDHVKNYRFSADQIYRMRELRMMGMSLGKLAKMFGASKGQMSEICNYKVWPHGEKPKMMP